jgi:hypothetical protein
MSYDDLHRHIAREIEESVVMDMVTGERRYLPAKRAEVMETLDGVTEKIVSPADMLALACRHMVRVGQRMSICEICTRENRQTTFVCTQCAINCPVCGLAACLKHSLPGPRGAYRCCSKRCLKQALKLGLDQVPGLDDDPAYSPHDRLPSRHPYGGPSDDAASCRPVHPRGVPRPVIPAARPASDNIVVRIIRGILSWW